MRMTTRYRELIKRPQIAVMVGAYDALSAKLVERAGFDLTFVHDYGVSASLLGMPDMGVVTLTEMTDILEKVVKAVNIPVIGDGGCGFGNPLNTWRTVREYESIGVAGVNWAIQIVPLKFLTASGSGTLSNAIKAVSDNPRSRVKCPNKAVRYFISVT